MTSDIQTIQTLKGLIVDGVHRANAGHPGGALSSLDFAYLLFTEFLQFDPEDPQWLGRDRFVLSAGHESMLLYSLLHLVGWLPMDELKRFRQLHSQTPGHPEVGLTPGVECTTGPLGQGAAMSVGMAMAALHFGQRLDQNLFDQKIYALLGDGCMQEGVTYATASMAGHLGLGNLTWFYDYNKIQISGSIDRAYSDNVEMIYQGLGWQVTRVSGHDHDALRLALKQSREPRQQPLLIIGDTVIAKGTATMEGSAKTHGSPLPEEERRKSKESWGIEGDFSCSDDAIRHFRRNFGQKAERVKQWYEVLNNKRKQPSFDRLYQLFFESEPARPKPISWSTAKPLATRSAFGDIIAAWADELPQLVGGSADLEPSNMTGAFAQKVGDFAREQYQNRNIAFGVREFPMSAIANGLALFGGLVPFDATFLTFSDYARPALRLGAIQKSRVIHEYTHDSFYLGEDGPTHQPVEHLMSLRSIPGLYVMRPADGFETEALMQMALELKGPCAICLTRQGVPFLSQGRSVMASAQRGGYVVRECTDPELIIFATGSEVHLALEVADEFKGQNVKVVSLPCWELFAEQSEAYRQSVIEPNCKRRVSIEAGSTLGWQYFVGRDGLTIGRDAFGDSAPYEVLVEHYGFTKERVKSAILSKWY